MPTTIISARAEDASQTQLANAINDLAWGIYGPKLSGSCDITPYWTETNRCGTCGDTISSTAGPARPEIAAGRIDGFCGHRCARTFFVNHNWQAARYAAAHRAKYTCARCGYRPDINTDSQAASRELVVRHIHLPPSRNPRSRGCHQHLSNLVTLCRACDPLPATARSSHSNAPVGRTATAAPEFDLPITTVSADALAAGLCCGTDPELWFDPMLRRRAARICVGCPVRARCAQYALELRVTDGVYAGVSLPGKRNPRALRARRRELQKLIDTAAPADRTQAPPQCSGASSAGGARTDLDNHRDQLGRPAAELERAGA